MGGRNDYEHEIKKITCIIIERFFSFNRYFYCCWNEKCDCSSIKNKTG